MPRPDLRQRAAVVALRAGVAVLRALPDRLVFRCAYAIGAGLSLVLSERRMLVTENLRQVCAGLVDAGLASPRVQRAATDEGNLRRMVRAAFGHWVLGYAESAVIPGYTPDELQARVHRPADAEIAEALAPLSDGPPGRIFISAHFGTVELAGLYAVTVTGMRLSAPMETVADPALQRYFEETRGARGIALVPIRGASVPLRGALERGEAVALVADRVIGGSGLPVRLFGATGRLPLGPAVLALETGAPAFVVGMRRTGWARWAPFVQRLDLPADGPLRERIRASLDAQARAFERMIAEAPEQWWTVQFRIWPDRAVDTHPAAALEAAA